MKVFIVTQGSYSNYGIERVFRSLSVAKRYVKSNIRRRSLPDWNETQWDDLYANEGGYRSVHYLGAMESPIDEYLIEEWETMGPAEESDNP